MKKISAKILFSSCFLLLTSSLIYSQQENVPLDHDVYLFLKNMKVKKILDSVHDDNPNMSRAEVRKHLEAIIIQSADLSNTEKKLLQKFRAEFYDNEADSANSFQLFGSAAGFSKSYSDLLSDKLKYTYTYREEDANFNLEILGRFLYGQNFKPIINNSELYDIGFRMRGTLFNKLGYNLTVQKGGVSGSQNLAPTFDPRLKYNFKFFERLENIGNYDFTEGYLRYYTEPIEKMSLSFQIGREKLKLGYGYGSRLVLSGDHPNLDFIKIDFNYGIFSFISIHASTVGEFHDDRSLNYTKYYAYNRFKLSFKNLFDFGFGEAIVYSGRGIDLAYLNPFIFYKFAEMSLQDRDNGAVFLDLQTSFLKNVELQATFFIDENILSHLQELNLFSNKTAYQIGAYWYSPFSIRNLSLIFEYTRIRPFVYSHTNIKNSYTSFGENLGHRAGPNADEIYAKATYNFNEWIRINFEFQRVRSGENFYDPLGNLLFNAGGEPLLGHRANVDKKYINFLEGERINHNIFTLSFRIEPIREVIFDLVYKYIAQTNLTREIKLNTNYTFLKMMFEI